MDRITLGDFELSIFSDGVYPLDGGAFFGVVPKVMWSKKVTADDRNFVVAGLNSLLIRTGQQNILVETGIGNKLSEKQRSIFEARQLLPQSFQAAAIRPEEVDVVINTHLHFDHCGWNTTRKDDGSIVPTFPNARYIVHRGEVEHGHLQLERDAVSYISENYDPLIASGQMSLIDPPSGAPVEIVPGVSVEVFPGHTAQMMAVMLDSGGHRACYISDHDPPNHLLARSTSVRGIADRYELEPC